MTPGLTVARPPGSSDFIRRRRRRFREMLRVGAYGSTGDKQVSFLSDGEFIWRAGITRRVFGDRIAED